MSAGDRGGVRINPEIGIGQIAQVAVLVIGFGATWYFGGAAADMQRQINALSAATAINSQRITAVEALQAQLRQDFKDLAADLRGGISAIINQLGDIRAQRGGAR